MPQGVQLAPILRALSTVYVLAAAGCVDLARPPELITALDARVAAPRDTEPAPPMVSPPGTEDPDGLGSSPGVDAAVPDRPDGPAPDGPAGDGQPSPDTTALRTEGGQATDAVVGGGRADAADLRPALDGSGTAAALLIDDFSDEDQSTNALGGPVASDNQIVVTTGGELRFLWRGNGVFQSFVENLRPGSCPLDIRGYRTLRFRMRASTGDQVVQLLMGRANLGCATTTILAIGTVTLSTTMTSYSVDLTPIARDSASFFQWSPPATDLTVYTLDDVQLVP